MVTIIFLLNGGIDLGDDFYNKKSVQIKEDELIEENSFNKVIDRALLLEDLFRNLKYDSK